MEEEGAVAAGEFFLTERPYLLVTSIPCYVDEMGAVWLDSSWHHDLVEHASYLTNLVVCAPRLPVSSELKLVRFDPPWSGRVTFAFLPSRRSYLDALKGLPRTLACLWREVGRAEIVHSSIIGWPYPPGWFVNPIALLRRKKLVIVVESEWRIDATGPRRRIQRLLDMDWLRERAARWSCRKADLALFTHAGYKATLCGDDGPHANITPAVWVADEDILPDDAAERSWSEKPADVRLPFAARLLTV